MRVLLRSLSLFAAFAVTIVPSLCLAELFGASGARVTFAVTGSMGLHFDGTVRALSVADDGTALTVAVPLAGLSTGIDMRDEHTREALDVAHHGTASLSVPLASIQRPATGSARGDAQGSMSLHGRTHTVTFHYEATHRGDGFHVDGRVRLDIRHYGIEPPSYMGIHVNPQVDVHVTFDVHAR